MDERESGTKFSTVELTRRTVIETGSTALLLTTLPRSTYAAGQADDNEPAPARVELQINGHSHSLTLDPRTTLLDALREHLALTGSRRVAITANAAPAPC
jgi:xanthine dehydrogenase YagT iron-sulfur-binding subunit